MTSVEMSCGANLLSWTTERREGRLSRPEGRLSRPDQVHVLFTGVLGPRCAFSLIHSYGLALNVPDRSRVRTLHGMVSACMPLGRTGRGPAECQAGHFVGTM